MAVDEGDGWGDAVGELDRKAQAEESSGEAELVLADFVEEARAVAEDDGDAGDGVPDDVAEAAEAGEVGGDLVPVRVEGYVVRGADGEEALGAGGDGAGVSDVKLEGCAGGERRGEGDGGFVELAGVVGVRVEGGYGEGCVACAETDALPGEGAGDLQRDVGEGLAAVIADGEQGADGEVLVGGAEADVEIEVSEGDGLAFGVFGGGGVR